jgi:cytochrome c oxidase cbb3-type subunit 4
MDGALLHSLWTVLLLVIFVGIVVWVFIIKRSGDFDQAARMPLELDESDNKTTEGKGRLDG